MKLKVLTVNGSLLTLDVPDQSQAPVTKFLETGEAAGWTLCAYSNGWPVVLNLAQCITVERAP